MWLRLYSMLQQITSPVLIFWLHVLLTRWLEARLLSSMEIKMDNAAVQIAAGLRLGAPVDRPHVCVCRATVRPYSSWSSRPILSLWFWSSFLLQPDQRSASPCFHQFWYACKLWTSLALHHKWKTSHKCLENMDVVCLQKQLCPDTYADCIPSNQCTSRLSGFCGGDQQVAEIYEQSSRVLTLFLFPSKPREFEVCRPWN